MFLALAHRRARWLLITDVLFDGSASVVVSGRRSCALVLVGAVVRAPVLGMLRGAHHPAPYGSALPQWAADEAAAHPRLHRARSAPRRSTSSRRAGDAFELVGLSAGTAHERAGRAGARARRAPHRAGRPARRRARRRGVDGRRGARRPRGARARSSPSRTPTSCSTRSSARPASARRSSRSTEGIDLALANKESLVVGGELVMALAEATGAPAHPGRLRALRAAPADRRRAGRARSTGSSLTASGGPFRGALARRARGRDGRAGARAPDVGDGRQDHDRLGDADEQGPRGDRGPPPVRHAVRAASTSSCTRSRSSTRW